jgi:hypothetical protein
MLRGRDFENGIYFQDFRIQQFDKLKVAIDKVLTVPVRKWTSSNACETRNLMTSKSHVFMSV